MISLSISRIYYINLLLIYIFMLDHIVSYRVFPVIGRKHGF